MKWRRKVRKNDRERESMKEKKQCDGKTKPQEQRSTNFLPSRHHFLFRQPALWESVNEERWPTLSTHIRQQLCVESKHFSHRYRKYIHPVEVWRWISQVLSSTQTTHTSEVINTASTCCSKHTVCSISCEAPWNHSSKPNMDHFQTCLIYAGLFNIQKNKHD